MTIITGTATDNTLLGGTQNDTINGLGGNDTLNGVGGADTLIGGAGDDRLLGGGGNDTLLFDAADTRGVDGGIGTDTLRFAGSGQSLDLTAAPDDTYSGIEVIDLNDSGAILTLDAQSLLDLSTTSNTLRINGGSTDTVYAGSGWSFAGLNVVSGDTYRIFVNGQATLQIEAGITHDLNTSVISLARLDGTNGFRLEGIDARDYSGGSVASAGDVNGDGFDDLIIGAPGADPGGDLSAGESYVVFGKSAGFPSQLNLSALNGANGFRLDGIDVADSSGLSIAAAGDVNGDGFDDVIVGAFLAYSGVTDLAGESYVVFGKAIGFPSRMSLGALNGANGFRVDGVNAYDVSGFSVASAGDVNGDGFDDLIVGAPFADPGGNSYAGESYVVFGRSGGFPSSIGLSSLNGANGFRLDGIDADDSSGYSVASAGDVNGDGFDDLIIGAYAADPGGKASAGECYVVFGKVGGFASSLNLNALNGLNGFALTGVDASDFSGGSVASAGDVNGDGFDDLIIGASGAGPGGDSVAGESYVVFGKPGAFPSRLSLATLNGTNGFRLDGIDSDDQSGRSVASAGDVNGDGFDDLIIGANAANPGGHTGAGESYVLFGQANGFAPSLGLGALNGTNGFRLDGIDGNDLSGRSVASAGDVNGDGFDDLIIGAPFASPGGDSRAGENYVLFGGDFLGIVDVLGTTANNTLSGTGRNDTLNGLGGNDRLEGRNGSDVLVGGAGADRLFGGAGNDRYFIDRANEIDKSIVDAGSDTVRSTVNYTLGAQQEHLTLLGNASSDGTGNTQGNVLTGNDGSNRLLGLGGNDTLNGNGGADVLAGGAGNDLYFIDRTSEIDKSVVDAGTDTVRSTVSYTLGAQQEHLTLLGNAALNGTGNTTANTLIGNNGGNQLIGAGGNDALKGSGGNDTLIGGAGDDRLLGGGGNDTLIFDATDTRGVDGGIGTDTLRFSGIGKLLDLTVVPEDQLTKIEIIDLNGSGAMLTLDAASLLNLTSTSTTLRIEGDSTDTVHAGNGWGFGELIIDNGQSYARFSQGAAVLEVDADINHGLHLPFLSLSALNGTNGFRLDGIDASDESGISVASAGDVNGDGFADLIIGARYADASGDHLAGESYVVFGKADGFVSSLDLGALNGTNGFRLDGNDAYDRSGRSVAGAGDVNGDGFDDVIIGASFADSGGDDYAGESYVVFGKAGGFISSLDLGALNGTNGFRLHGIDEYDFSGVSVAGAGDVNGDGFDELIIGAINANPGGHSLAGESYLVFGKSAGFASSLDFTGLNGTNGFRLDGIDVHDRSGNSVASAGDVNGDGFDDVIVGAYHADPGGDFSAGESYVVFGKSGGFASSLDLEALNGTDGFRLDGVDQDDRSGDSVASAGDVNGDGFGDLIIGAPVADPIGGSSDGESYVVFGKAGGFASSLDLGSLNGTDGFRLAVIDVCDFSGTSVAAAGDVNGDGFGDLIIGASGADPIGGSFAGGSYVVFGKAGGFASFLDLGALNGSDGFRLDGIDVGDGSGRPVAGAGDVDGDGFDDLIIGASGADPGGDSRAGESYVVFGGDFRDEVDFLGSTSVDNLTGTTDDEILVGAQGNDTINGDAGADTLKGGSGMDSLSGSVGEDRLEGGADADALDGGDDDDRLEGGNGNDTLDGGTGNDVLVGGAGNDTFRFDDAPGSSNIDTIMDFGGAGSIALDVIALDNASGLFDALTEGELPSGAFESSPGLTQAATADGRIVYDTTTGNLYYDPDGNAVADNAVQFAIIATDPNGLSAADFVVI